MQKFLVAFTFLLFGATFLGAQSAEISNIADARPASGKAVMGNPDQAFYADQENNKTYFIDFENLHVNLSNIIVKDVLGGVVFKDEVSSLPVNTIYELDLSRMAPGTYDIELRSYTGVIRKTVTLP